MFKDVISTLLHLGLISISRFSMQLRQDEVARDADGIIYISFEE